MTIRNFLAATAIAITPTAMYAQNWIQPLPDQALNDICIGLVQEIEPIFPILYMTIENADVFYGQGNLVSGLQEDMRFGIEREFEGEPPTPEFLRFKESYTEWITNDVVKMLIMYGSLDDYTVNRPTATRRLIDSCVHMLRDWFANLT